MVITKIWFDNDRLYGMTDDGKTVWQSLLWYKRLNAATDEHRMDYEIDDEGIHWYALDEDVSFEISFEPAVKIDGIEAEAEIDLPNIPLGIGVLSADINPKIAISADLGVSLGFGAEQPVCISSHSDPSGTAKSCNENAVKYYCKRYFY